MALKNAIKAAPSTSRDSATFNNTFQGLSAAGGILGATVLLRIINASNTFVGVSYDGVTVHDCVLAGSVLELNFQTNSQPSNMVAALPKGTNVYVIGAAAGVGFVFLATYYQSEGY